MFGIDFTFLWTALNLLIIYYVVNKFLFKKLGAFMEERSSSIASDIQKGETLIRDGEELNRRQNEVLADANQKRNEILNEARQRAAKEYDALMAQAKEDAAEVLKRAREEGEREREQALKEMKKEIASLAISAASKVIEANMDTEKNRELVNRFLTKEEAA